MSYTIKLIILEVAKLIQFCTIWAIPLFITKATGNYFFLLLLIFSWLLTALLWKHYEYLTYRVFKNKLEEDERESLQQRTNKKG